MKPYKPNNDDDYADWLATHPDGFVVNVRKSLGLSYFVLHTASCSSINPTRRKRPRGAYTRRSYRKFLAEEVDTLIAWGEETGFYNPSTCRICLREHARVHELVRGWRPDHADREHAADDSLLATAYDEAEGGGAFDPDDSEDARRRTMSAIAQRRGQQKFRQELLVIYRERCAFTGCTAVQALEAAHITPYRGPQTNCPTNGLLLRSDVHTLFDLGLITIAPGWTIMVAGDLDDSEYVQLRQKKLEIAYQSMPSDKAVAAHRDWAMSRYTFP